LFKNTTITTLSDEEIQKKSLQLSRFMRSAFHLAIQSIIKEMTRQVETNLAEKEGKDLSLATVLT